MFGGDWFDFWLLCYAYDCKYLELASTDSVLCGSKKYPSRDPFAHLLKGSLQTFLNAMTYPDRTVYPVSIIGAFCLLICMIRLCLSITPVFL